MKRLSVRMIEVEKDDQWNGERRKIRVILVRIEIVCIAVPHRDGGGHWFTETDFRYRHNGPEFDLQGYLIRGYRSLQLLRFHIA